MGFWSDLKKATPHQGVARGKELASSNIIDIVPIHAAVEGSGEICSVCRAQFGALGFKNVQPYTVTVDEATPLSFANSNAVIVCAKCIEVFNV